jgi:hypothetical protein
MKLSELITASRELAQVWTGHESDLDPEVLIDGDYHPVAIREVKYGIQITGGRVTGHLVLISERED